LHNWCSGHFLRRQENLILFRLKQLHKLSYWRRSLVQNLLGAPKMLEDRLLVWKLKHGNRDALRLIYEKYKNDLLTLATALSNDMATAEDVVHDVFVSFAECASKLQLRTSLRSYLLTSIANRVRNLRTKRQQTTGLTELDVADPVSDTPDKIAISAEESQQIGNAMGQLPYEQREVIILHLQSGLKFKAIAESQGVSINTVQSRYRYGLHKLQTILNGEVKK